MGILKELFIGGISRPDFKADYIRAPIREKALPPAKRPNLSNDERRASAAWLKQHKQSESAITAAMLTFYALFLEDLKHRARQKLEAGEEPTPENIGKLIDVQIVAREMRDAILPEMIAAAIAGAKLEWNRHAPPGADFAPVAREAEEEAKRKADLPFWLLLAGGLRDRAVQAAAAEPNRFAANIAAGNNAAAGGVATMASTTMQGAGQGAGRNNLLLLGLFLRKKWVTVGDDRVRPSHREANGQVIDIIGSFEVGGHLCSYPGDPSLPLAERIGCRCHSVTLLDKIPLHRRYAKSWPVFGRASRLGGKSFELRAWTQEHCDQRMLRKAFTGTVTASNGAVYHYVDGQRVAAPDLQGHLDAGNPQSKDDKVHPAEAKKKVDEHLANVDQLDPDKLAALHSHLSNMSVGDLRSLAQKLGVPQAPNKGHLIQGVHDKLAEQAGHKTEAAPSGAVLALGKKLADPGKLTDEEIAAIPEALSRLNIGELKTLKKQLGTSGGTKPEIVAAIHAKLGGSAATSEAKPAPKEPPAAQTTAGVPESIDYSEVYNVPTSHLQIDPERFQFKLNVNKEGVTDELHGVEFNPLHAGVILVWRDPANNKDFVINGHHRHDLARRSNYPNLAVRYIDAKDAAEARAQGALTNIAEGRGTAIDAAKFMRDTGKTADDMQKHGVSLKGKVAAEANVLAKLSDPLFHKLTLGQVDQDTVMPIARHLADDHAGQSQLLSYIEQQRDERGKDIHPAVVDQMAQEWAAAPKLDDGGPDLFGDTGPTSTFLDRNMLKAKVHALLAKEHRDFSAVANERRAEAVSREGKNVLDVAGNKEQTQRAAEILDAFKRQAAFKGGLSDILNEETVAFARAKNEKERNEIAKRTTDRVRQALEDDRGAVGRADGQSEGDSAPERSAQSEAGAADARGADQRGAGVKQPHEMTRDEWQSAIDNSPHDSFVTSHTEDWGNLRGQGRRSGGMVLGGMRDSSLQGKKTYLNLFGKLPPEESREANTALVGAGLIAYGKARAAGFDHDHAMIIGYSAGGEDVDAHRLAVENALAAGKPVPSKVLADYPDLTAKHKQKSFDESKHPRDHGKFSSTAGAGASPDHSESSQSSRVARILAAAVHIPRQAIDAARKLGTAAMAKIEQRYGKTVKRAVQLAVLASLPLPAPGMSVLISAPIVAFAELYRQFSSTHQEKAIADDKLITQLADEVISELFGGKVPDEVRVARSRSQIVEKAFDPSEARDENGKWTSGGGNDDRQFKIVEPKTQGAKVSIGHGGQREAFKIATPAGALITGYIADQDFPGQKSSATRGELFFAEVPKSERRKGIGRSLVEDAIALLKTNGTETVNLSATSNEGRALISALLRDGVISGPIQTSSTGKQEYKIGDVGPSFHGQIIEKSFDESKHPRDDHGRFVSAGAIAEAKADPAKAKELRAKVTDPEQRKKLDAALGEPTEEKKPKYPASPGLSPEDAELEQRSQEMFHEGYFDLRDKYLAREENVTRRPDGSLQSVVLNTDEWRELFPGYTGPNANAVHRAASDANKKLLAEMIETQKGKGNNTFVIFAGGGGSGKGTSVKQYFDESQFPIRLDQTSDSVIKLNDLFDRAKMAGYTPGYVFVDRHPEEASKGVVQRALNLRKAGKPARTVPLEISLQANIDARKAAIEILKTRMDVEPNVLDNNHGHMNAVLIKDRQEAIAYLESQNHDLEELKGKLREHTTERYRQGEIPDDIAAGLLGHETVKKIKKTSARDPHAKPGEPPPKDKPVTLVYGGSFSPIHTGHINGGLLAAKKHMESLGYKIGKVVLAPSADKLLRAKLGDELVPLKHRTEMARLATQDHPWIDATSGPGEEAENHAGKLKRTQLADWAARQYPDTTIVNVTGEDAAPGTSRPGSVYAGDAGTSHEGYYYMETPRDLADPGALSSSKIRRAMKEGTPLPEGAMHPEAEAYYRDYLSQSKHRDKSIGALFEKHAKYDESKHPRDKQGKFVSVGDIGAAASDPAKRKEIEARLDDANKAKLHAAIETHKATPAKKPPGSQMDDKTKNGLRAAGMVGTFPPADVPIADVKIADLSRGAEALKFEPLMSWNQTTKSGRVSRQYRYTQEFHDRNAAEKHERVASIKPVIGKITETLTGQMADANLPMRQREAAAIASVIRETGLRPTDGDESIKHGHFGISSLQARHVKVAGNEIHLDFIGKEGIRNKAIIREPANVAFIKKAVAGVNPKDFVFKSANSDDAGDALKSASKAAGGPEDIKIKDLRTLKAHQLGEMAVANFKGPPPPLSGDKKKDAKLVAKAILEMSTQVSNVLNNKPTESRDTYIHPRIFKDWQASLV